MDFLRVLGFVMILVLVITGLDYYQQYKKHDGTLSATGYVDTIKDRFAQIQTGRDAKTAEAERKHQWELGAKPYLPAPSDQWARFELTDASNAAVASVLAEYKPTPLISSVANTAELLRLSGGDKQDILRKLSETGAVYSSGDELAWFDISLKPAAARNTLAGLALARQQSFMDLAVIKNGFAVVDGVAFIEIEQDLTSPTEALGYRKITGRIGIDEEVVIRLHTNADDASIRALLEGLDYAALNALLTYPSPVVGQGYVIPADRQSDLADQIDRLYAEMKLVQEKTTDDKLKNLDVAALMVNQMTASGFESEGLMDITGGEVFENQDVLQIGYGRALQLLFESEERQAALEDDITSEAPGLLGFLQDQVPAQTPTDAAEPAEKPAQEEPTPQPVRVHKGGLGDSCAKFGSGKRCSASGQ